MAHRDGKITIVELYAAPFSFRTRLLEMIQFQVHAMLDNPSAQEAALVKS
ncbi:MAG: hypothetical protein P8Q26_13300 [Ascidiaceihabitans sp.]|nr:hypothetical protein [Ascidiaceihabitans sp.]